RWTCRFGRCNWLGRRRGWLHRARSNDHGLLEIILASCAGGGRLAHILELILAELDDISVLKDVLADRLTIDHGAVSTAKILKKSILANDRNRCVLPTDGQVINLDVIAGATPDGSALFVQCEFTKKGTVQ